MRIDELIGSLQTFKINLEEIRKSKGKAEKNITLQAKIPIATNDETIIEYLQEQLVFLNQNFNRAFKKLTRRNRKFDVNHNSNKAKGNE
ncbi:hypothetical protein PVK06_013057 [Gossypium arboreum]|uniref:Uncharacterized protein n=1 Tax=Gossypium arboreum TaxID=29729 RepID=A0ABR0QE88_GOSAR|nr:hypothetical protein PVK06_013057 [Gossypium arboreum]